MKHRAVSVLLSLYFNKVNINKRAYLWGEKKETREESSREKEKNVATES